MKNLNLDIEREIPYLSQKIINSKFSLDLSVLPEISKDYIFKQVIEYAKNIFLVKEANNL